jgi:hypothetical protein
MCKICIYWIIIIIQFNTIKLFIIYAPNQQLPVQLQTENSVDTGNNINYKYNIKAIAI